MSRLIFFVLLAAATPQLALAWGDLGHQATAEIAERFLTPKGKKLIYEVFGNGPLAEASTAPDLFRSDKEYSEFSNYHFVEIDPRWKVYEQVPEALVPDHNADAVLSLVPKKLFAFSGLLPKFNKSQRKDLLRYLVHVVGDVHQPLHVGNSFDRGANWCEVKYPSNSGKSSDLMKTNLHSLWDGTLVQYVFVAQGLKDPSYKQPSWKGYFELADLILKDADIVALKPEYRKISKEEISQWYQQSQSLHSQVYPNSSPSEHPMNRSYCKHLVRDENGVEKKDKNGVTIVVPNTSIAEVDTAYMQKSAEVIKLQLLKGGLRLANLINKIAEKNVRHSLDPEQKTKDLQEMLKAINN